MSRIERQARYLDCVSLRDADCVLTRCSIPCTLCCWCQQVRETYEKCSGIFKYTMCLSDLLNAGLTHSPVLAKPKAEACAWLLVVTGKLTSMDVGNPVLWNQLRRPIYFSPALLKSSDWSEYENLTTEPVQSWRCCTFPLAC
jgi:hypothetical protein